MTQRFSATVVLCVVTLLVGNSLLIAQKQGDAASSPSGGRLYRLESIYTAGIAQNYEFTESSNVVRTHSDGSVKKYSRMVTDFITIRTIESMNGIAKIVVTLDSLLYHFSSDAMAVDYNSQVDVVPKPFADLTPYLGPLNRTFTLTMNSYGEVTSLEGEDIDFWRDYLKENSPDLDSVTALLWEQSLSNINLKQMGDIQKRIIPGLKVGIDSTWKHSLELRINGVHYTSEVASKFAQNTGGLYVITTNDTLRAKPQIIRTYGIPEVSHLLSGWAAINGELTLRNTGVVEELVLKTKAWYQAKVAMETYVEDINTTYTWKLIGQYQW